MPLTDQRGVNCLESGLILLGVLKALSFCDFSSVKAFNWHHCETEVPWTENGKSFGFEETMRMTFIDMSNFRCQWDSQPGFWSGSWP